MSILRDPMLQPPGIATLRLAEPRDERAEHARWTRASRDHLVGRLEARRASVASIVERVVGARDARAEALEHLRHDVDVGDVGHVGDAR